jgi:Domain of unknown function (DUF3387)
MRNGSGRFALLLRPSTETTLPDTLDIADCGAKVRALIEEAVIAEGIQILVKQVSLFTPEFEEKLKAFRSEEARASEMEHAIKNEIHVKLDEDPAFYSSLRERLEKLIEVRKAKRIDAAQHLQLFEVVRTDLRGRNEVAESLGMSETSFAIYGLIATPKPMTLSDVRGPAYGSKVDESKKVLAELLEEQLEPQVSIVDWTTKEEVQREMRRLIKRQLTPTRSPILSPQRPQRAPADPQIRSSHAPYTHTRFFVREHPFTKPLRHKRPVCALGLVIHGAQPFVNGVAWHPLLDTYRTLLAAPTAEMRVMFDTVRQMAA